ncbi:MAG TPA: nitrate reductase cytochrome c-type subunit [Burkholderiales bacterium]|nr:nitrate reductase cytochrome c-type subunit [Burkholderiales bacterium]
MKTTTKVMLAALAAAFAAACATQLVEPPQSLRGADAADADRQFEPIAYQGKRPGSQQGYTRTYSTQPPLIPHAVENFDEVTLEDNQCLECHSPANYVKKQAPVVGEKHFVAGSKTQLSNARYACVMCHVPQADAKPLVENTFQGDRIIPAAQKK